MESNGELLIDRLLYDGSDEDTAELLKECQNGFPVQGLRPLLQSDRETTVKAGTWILSELGENAAPLVSEIAKLLVHRVRYVRFFAVDIALAAAGPDDQEVLAATARLIDDADAAIRWKAMMFLRNATVEQIDAACNALRAERLGRDLAAFSRTVSEADLAWILEALRGRDSRVRLLAVVGAARLQSDTSPGLEAMPSGNSD